VLPIFLAGSLAGLADGMSRPGQPQPPGMPPGVPGPRVRVG